MSDLCTLLVYTPPSPPVPCQVLLCHQHQRQNRRYRSNVAHHHVLDTLNNTRTSFDLCSP
jgi:hypothetical protein